MLGFAGVVAERLYSITVALFYPEEPSLPSSPSRAIYPIEVTVVLSQVNVVVAAVLLLLIHSEFSHKNSPGSPSPALVAQLPIVAGPVNELVAHVYTVEPLGAVGCVEAHWYNTYLAVLYPLAPGSPSSPSVPFVPNPPMGYAEVAEKEIVVGEEVSVSV